MQTGVLSRLGRERHKCGALKCSWLWNFFFFSYNFLFLSDSEPEKENTKTTTVCPVLHSGWQWALSVLGGLGWGLGGGHSSRTCPQFFLSLFEGCAVTSVSENKLIGWQGRQSGRGSRCLIQIHVMKNVFQVQQHGVCSNLMIFLHVTDFYKQGFLIWLYSLKTKTSVCVCVCVHLTSSVTLICDSAAKWCHWLVCSFPVSSTLVTYKNPTYLKYFRGEKDPTQTLHPPPTTELKLVANY